MVVQNLEDIRPYLELTRPYVEYTAVIFGAVSGALHAKRRSFDFVGVVIIGIVSGLGGGLVRDVLIGSGPVLALRSPALLNVAIVSSLVGVLFVDTLVRPRRPSLLGDRQSFARPFRRGRTAAGAIGRPFRDAERVTRSGHLRWRWVSTRRALPGDAPSATAGTTLYDDRVVCGGRVHDGPSRA